MKTPENTAPAFNFESMSISELIEARKALNTALDDKVLIEEKELEARAAALAEVRGNIAPPPREKRQYRRREANGSDDIGKTHALKGRAVPAKYRGPNGETWTGRGLAPRWLTALEQKGRNRDRFLIKSN